MVTTKLIRLPTIADSIFMTKKLGFLNILSAVVRSHVELYSVEESDFDPVCLYFAIKM